MMTSITSRGRAMPAPEEMNDRSVKMPQRKKNRHLKPGDRYDYDSVILGGK